MTSSIHITLIMHAILPLEHDRGQTDSRAQSQRLSVAHHSHMVDPDWIQILRKATPTVFKEVTCHCSENSYFRCVIDHKYQGPS